MTIELAFQPRHLIVEMNPPTHAAAGVPRWRQLARLTRKLRAGLQKGCWLPTVVLFCGEAAL